MRKAVIATRRPTPHSNPSPEGEGLRRPQSQQSANRHEKVLLPREKGWDEGYRSLMKVRAEQEGYDQARTVGLGEQGFRVIRFWNNDVVGNTEAVLEELLSTLRANGTADAP